MKSGSLVAGRYRLDRPIAAGGMGEVWRGFDLVLERPVAVKLQRRGLGSSLGGGDRFAREAKILAGLSGPGLPEVYDYGEHASRRWTERFIIMELIEGTPLSTLIQERGPLTPDETLRHLTAAADALAIAHARGVVHRDIKPSNLLIEPGGNLRIVDFGISLADGDARLTSADDIMGTTSYVSPEQISRNETSGAADLYALGAVAYECLTGRPPFTADHPREVLYKHLHEEPPPLPDHIPSDAAAVVARCLRKEPDERWPTAKDLAAACATARLQSTVDLPAPPTGSRRPVRAVIVAAAVLLPALITGVTMWHPWIPADGRPEADPVVFRSPGVPPEATAAAVSGIDEPTEPVPAVAAVTTPPSGAVVTSPLPTSSLQQPPQTFDVLPDVTGMDAAEAQAHLNDRGWPDVRIAPTLLFTGAQPEGCEIVSQDPEPGRTVGYDQPVEIAYWGLHDCP
ncbi:protein kinase [Glycomyces sp. NPDC021274]|uniref:serine/threonine-protein kinase n=1 Tax=Glycomyces sp. NPDC021274 TaxID=3155120 RepID=UPI0033E5C262